MEPLILGRFGARDLSPRGEVLAKLLKEVWIKNFAYANQRRETSIQNFEQVADSYYC